MPNAYIELIDSLILQRQALKISQRELASAAGVSWTEVALMEQFLLDVLANVLAGVIVVLIASYLKR